MAACQALWAVMVWLMGPREPLMTKVWVFEKVPVMGMGLAPCAMTVVPVK